MPLGRSLIALLALCSAVAADDLTTLDGKKVTGSLSSISDTAVIVKGAEGAVSTPLSQALLLTLRDVKGLGGDAVYSDVQLLDDTVLHCKSVKFLGKNVDLV